MNTNTLTDEQIKAGWESENVTTNPYCTNLKAWTRAVRWTERAIESAVRGAPDAPQEHSVHPAGSPSREHAAEAGSGEHHKLDTDSQVFFYEQDFYVLSNFSAFNLVWRGRTFPTSEHAYHWEKFVGSDDWGAGECRAAIIDAPSAHEAFKRAEQMKPQRRWDWDDIKVDRMLDILRAKANQHEYVRRKLLATGDRELIEDSWRDDYWGWGPNRDGQNMLGKLWMQVRAELCSHASQEAARPDVEEEAPAPQAVPLPVAPDRAEITEIKRLVRLLSMEAHSSAESQSIDVDATTLSAIECIDRLSHPAGQIAQAPTVSGPVASETDAFLAEVHAELIRARAKFPGDRVMTIALAEEFGELCKAVLDESSAQVRKEAVQTAVMACRVAIDGDSSVDEWRRLRGLDPLTCSAIRAAPPALCERLPEASGSDVKEPAAEPSSAPKEKP